MREKKNMNIYIGIIRPDRNYLQPTLSLFRLCKSRRKPNYFLIKVWLLVGLHRTPNTGQGGFPQQEMEQVCIKGDFIQLRKGGIKNGIKNYKHEENIKMCSVLDSGPFLKEKFLLDFSTQQREEKPCSVEF